MPDRVAEIASKVFGVPADAVKDETSPDDLEAWDSLRHLQFVMALEGEFGISLTPEDVMEMLSIKLVRMILAERGVSLV